MELLIIGDIHGCLDQLKELTENIDRTKTRIILCGDLIDRGPNSIGVINYVRDNNIECVLGNHELMFIECRDSIKQLAKGKELTRQFEYELKGSNWFYNGGNSVFLQYNGDYKQMLTDLDFLDTFPTFIRTGIYSNEDREIVVSHTMILDYLDDDCTTDFSTEFLVWNRVQYPKNPLQKFLNVHGHTPVDYAYPKETAITGYPIPIACKGHTAINLDTGAPYNTPLRGYLSGMYFPSGEVVQVKTFKE
jgi:serine/threonine protein phosphatase 1